MDYSTRQKAVTRKQRKRSTSLKYMFFYRGNQSAVGIFKYMQECLCLITFNAAPLLSTNPRLRADCRANPANVYQICIPRNAGRHSRRQDMRSTMRCATGRRTRNLDGTLPRSWYNAQLGSCYGMHLIKKVLALAIDGSSPPLTLSHPHTFANAD